MKKIALIISAIILSQVTFSQKNVKTSFEKVKAQCEGVALDQRVRLTVARFSVTTGNAPSEFGGNLATMLTNALFKVNCFRVLESLKNKADLEDEIDHGEGKYAKKSASPKKGKQLGAQFIVTGEITEYNSKDNAVRVGIIKVGSNKAKIGFILKVTNPETRDVIYSESINVEGKTGSGTELGAFGINVISSGTSDPAVANACELGIIKAVEFLASKKDEMLVAGGITPKASTSKVIQTTETEIELKKTNFANFNEFATFLATLPTFKSVEKTFKKETATYTVTHTGTSDAFIDVVSKTAPAKFEVTSVDKGKLELKVKKE
jgi:curli biogenesis system outer membrane secretion channel CsgG